jgi:hypothetical protein
MSLFTTRSWLLVTALLLGGAASALAQPGQSPVAPEIFAPGHWTPFAPVDVDPDFRWFAEPELSEYGCDRPDANEGFFFQYDRLIWAFTRPKITEIGNPGAERHLFLPAGFGQPIGLTPNGGVINYFNSLDTEFIETEFVWGNRFELGYVVDDHGWLVSAMHAHTHDNRLVTRTILPNQPSQGTILDGVNDANVAFFDPLGVTFGFLDLNGDGFDDDLNSSGIFGRDGIDTDGDGVPDTPSVLGPDIEDQALSPIRFDTLIAQNRTSMHGVELMKVWRLPRMHYGGVWEWLLGARYIGMTDEFSIDANGGILADFDLFSRVNNFIVGPQVGARWSRSRGRWTVSAEGRFLAAANFQQVRLNGGYATLAVPGGPRGAFQNLASSRFDDAQTDEEFSPVGELRLETQLRLTRAISLRMGYNGLVAGGTSRASRRINYVLPEPSILDGRTNEAFIVNGFNFGFELNR